MPSDNSDELKSPRFSYTSRFVRGRVALAKMPRIARGKQTMKVVVRHSGRADIEAPDQSVLDLKDMTDSLVRQHLSLEVAHDLMHLDHDFPVRARREAG